MTICYRPFWSVFKREELGVVAHVYNLCTWVTEAGATNVRLFVSSRPARTIQWDSVLKIRTRAWRDGSAVKSMRTILLFQKIQVWFPARRAYSSPPPVSLAPGRWKISCRCPCGCQPSHVHASIMKNKSFKTNKRYNSNSIPHLYPRWHIQTFAKFSLTYSLCFYNWPMHN